MKLFYDIIKFVSRIRTKLTIDIRFTILDIRYRYTIYDIRYTINEKTPFYHNDKTEFIFTTLFKYNRISNIVNLISKISFSSAFCFLQLQTNDLPVYRSTLQNVLALFLLFEKNPVLFLAHYRG